jgi:hypothetical protein
LDKLVPTREGGGEGYRNKGWYTNGTTILAWINLSPLERRGEERDTGIKDGTLMVQPYLLG